MANKVSVTPEPSKSDGIIAKAYKYQTGDGVTKDFEKAIQLYSEALKAGRCDAAIYLFHIARFFQFGHGVRKDPARAKALFDNYSQSCGRSSDPWAMLALSESYTYGVGTPPQYRTAILLSLKVLTSWESAQDLKDQCKQVAHDLEYAAGLMQWSQTKSADGIMDQRRVDWPLLFLAYSKASSFGDAGAQNDLAYMYENGWAVEQDARKAFELYSKSAEQGNNIGQASLAALYEKGVGVLQNYVEALKWYDLAAMSGSLQLVEARDTLARQMTPRDVAQAQQLARAFLEEHSTSTAGPSQVKRDMPTVSGTGFFISEEGYLLTNHHVVSGATKIVVKTEHEELPASVVCADIPNDLALLKVNGTFVPIPLGNVRDVGLGDSVMTVGFPNIEVQGVSPKLTRGEISSLSGAQDDPRVFQISVPVQPGNSGGALIDASGNAIGITTAQLNALAALKSSGSLPQNVNYAVKISYARLLVDAVPHLADKLPPAQKGKLDSTVVTDRATHGTVLVFVWTKQ